MVRFRTVGDMSCTAAVLIRSSQQYTKVVEEIREFLPFQNVELV